MSLKLWCPDCNTQTIVDMMSVYDGYEFACDDCKRVFYVRIERGLTPLAPDRLAELPSVVNPLQASRLAEVSPATFGGR